MTLKIGDKAPDFTLPSDTGAAVSLASLRGKNIILYFYPRDDTPGCTQEACDFRDGISQYANLNAEIIGVSKDDENSHQKFKKKFSLPFTLLSDTNGDVCNAYEIIGEKNMYGKKIMGILRSTFLIDEQGIIRAIWRNVKVTGHSEKVLDELNNL
jgi:peroxiredoxin Q/BCP